MCQTRDVSAVGCFLDTTTPIELGAHVAIAIFDRSRGSPVELVGEVIRVTGGGNPGVGVQFRDPPEDWRTPLTRSGRTPSLRMKVLPGLRIAPCQA